MWQKTNNDPVCFGARDDQYGAFNVTKTGLVKGIKLVHRHGSIKCNPSDIATYWSCSNAVSMQTTRLWQSSQNPVDKLFCQVRRKLKIPHHAITKSISMFLKDLIKERQSWYLSRSRDHCVYRKAKSCRYGMGRTGRTVQQRKIVTPHASMYLPGTCDQSILFHAFKGM